MARPEAKLKELKTAELKHEVGARSDLVVKVNRRSERRIIPYGEEFLFEKLPVGTRVIYPPPPTKRFVTPCSIPRTRTRCSRSSVLTCA
jgi:hypothetical protein